MPGADLDAHLGIAIVRADGSQEQLVPELCRDPAPCCWSMSPSAFCRRRYGFLYTHSEPWPNWRDGDPATMWQTDIIYHGLDLADYIDCEFGHRADRWADDDRDPHATVEFWRDYL